MRIRGELAWPHRVREAIVALDGQRIGLDALQAVRVPVDAGEHTLTVLLRIASPCYPGSDAETRVRRSLSFEVDAARAAVITIQLDRGSLLDPTRRFAVRFREQGTVTDAERLATRSRHPRLLRPVGTPPADCSLLSGEHATHCRIASGLREALREGDIDTAWCHAQALDHLELTPPDPHRADMALAIAYGCADPGCFFAPPADELSPECEPYLDPLEYTGR